MHKIVIVFFLIGVTFAASNFAPAPAPLAPNDGHGDHISEVRFKRSVSAEDVRAMDAQVLAADFPEVRQKRSADSPHRAPGVPKLLPIV